MQYLHVQIIMTQFRYSNIPPIVTSIYNRLTFFFSFFFYKNEIVFTIIRNMIFLCVEQQTIIVSFLCLTFCFPCYTYIIMQHQNCIQSAPLGPFLFRYNFFFQIKIVKFYSLHEYFVTHKKLQHSETLDIKFIIQQKR